MKTLLITLLFICLTSQNSNENTLYKNYCRAVKNNYPIQNHLVITVKDLRTNEVREICTLGRILGEVIQVDKNLSYQKDDIKIANEIMLKNKRRYFEFATDSAIYNLGFQKYSIKELKKLEKRVNFDSIVKVIKKKGEWEMNAGEKDRLMYAHILFNKGILTRYQNGFNELVYEK